MQTAVQLNEDLYAMLDPKYRSALRENESLRRLAKRMIRRSGPHGAWRDYVADTMKFASYMKSSPDRLIENPPKWDTVLNNYLDEVYELGLAPSTQRLGVTAVRKWLDVNEVVSLDSFL
jgi:hypothetical protein